MPDRHRTVPGLLATGVLAAGLATVPVTLPTAGAAPDAGTGGGITWETCPDQVTEARAECGRVNVPMHHDDPDGAQISVGFVRVPAADPAARRGTLFGNPGGPGGDAYSFFGADSEDGGAAMQWPAGLSDEWDMVAVQPRGLPGSTPVDCSGTPAGWDPVRMQLQYGAFVTEACELGTPGYTDALNTWETAQDWEDVRAALGEDRISLLGLSYGTQLTSTYATLHPEHTDRLVLDSGYDPRLAWNGVMGAQTDGYIGALHDFLTWVADNDATYHLGTTPLAVYRAWSRVVVEESGTNPTVVPPPAEIGDLPPGLQWAGQPAADVLTAFDGPQAQLEGLFSQLTTPGAVQATSPTLALTRMTVPQPNQWGRLAELINGTAERPDADDLTEAFSQDDAATASNMQLLVMCNENRVAADPAAVPGYLWNGFVTGDPFQSTGATFTSGAACSGITPDAPVVDVSGAGLDTRPLQLQGTHDPQTPYPNHGPLAEAMGSHVITVDGPGHGQFGMGNDVVDAAVLEYLRTGHTDVTTAPGRPAS
jgi:pimeloyl-ACP methyl ester carboxylesterase